MARCESDGCERWRPEVMVRRGAGISVDGKWFCSEACVERMARRRLLATRQLSAGIPPVPPMRLGVLLRHQGAVTASQLQRALSAQRESGLKLGAQVLALGFTDGEGVLKALAAQAGVSYLASADPACVRQAPVGLSQDTVRALGLVPFGTVESGRIKTACVAPVPRIALSALRRLTGLTPEAYLVTDEDWTMLAQAYAESVATPDPSRPVMEFIRADSLSDAAAQIAEAANNGRQTVVTAAHWAPYTWVRVQGEGVIRDVLFARASEPDHSEETSCPAGSTSH